MPKKTYKPEEIVAKLRQSDVIAQGSNIPDAGSVRGDRWWSYSQAAPADRKVLSRRAKGKR
ncbi:hypothetical protein [Hyphomicrobium sp. D-2]|uniref:hypothetical protein n=1 Tax=Hyphomicrobium sp. D-2 TaxID=3041621 RepID=UPI002453DFDB|nr:hypothetical protein [Hyphomicrobium sp. D-2]MDH4982187.1 hypothetical protein [Hyphomicrobium sp. D-2]